jgi:hypothetical protein
MAALRAQTQAATIQNKARTGGAPPAAMTAANKANGKAKIEWEKRIIRSVKTSRRRRLLASCSMGREVMAG